LQIYSFITSEDIMTVTKDLCSWCSFGYEQLVQACGPWACTLLAAVSLVTRGCI